MAGHGSELKVEIVTCIAGQPRGDARPVANGAAREAKLARRLIKWHAE